MHAGQSACLPVGLLASSPSDGLTLRRSSLWLHAQSHSSSAIFRNGQALKHLEAPSPAPLLFPGSPSFRLSCPSQQPSWRDRTLLQSPSFQGARPVWSRVKRRPDCRVVLKSETARAGGYSLPLNVRFCFRKQRASQVSFHYLINCGKQTWLLSIGAQ